MCEAAGGGRGCQFIQSLGNPEIWDPKNGKIKIFKIEIRSAQIVGKAWISWKKILPAPFGAIPCHFLHGPKNPKNTKMLPIFCFITALWPFPEPTSSPGCYLLFGGTIGSKSFLPVLGCHDRGSELLRRLVLGHIAASKY